MKIIIAGIVVVGSITGCVIANLHPIAFIGTLIGILFLALGIYIAGEVKRGGKKNE
jgi:hypothetical protein